MHLYPLKFEPRFVEKMWGGRKLESVLGKPLPAGKRIGESWELYDFPPGIVDGSKDWISSPIINGPLAGRSLHEAVGEFGADLHGDVPPAGTHGQFPILIKFLDAREDLSVQVHPDHQYARSHPEAHLKSEAWYVLQSDSGSRLLNGLKPGTTRDQFESAIGRGDVDQLIRAIPAKEGDCFYLPSGTVHALGAGLLVAEVQTPSDTTFRVFDFNRVDPSTGRPRTLHVREALECIDFSPAAGEMSLDEAGSRLVASPYFHLHRSRLQAGAECRLEMGRPIVLIGIGGAAAVRTAGFSEPAKLGRGEVILLPAGAKDGVIETASGAEWLEVSFPS